MNYATTVKTYSQLLENDSLRRKIAHDIYLECEPSFKAYNDKQNKDLYFEKIVFVALDKKGKYRIIESALNIKPSEVDVMFMITNKDSIFSKLDFDDFDTFVQYIDEYIYNDCKKIVVNYLHAYEKQIQSH